MEWYIRQLFNLRKRKSAVISIIESYIVNVFLPIAPVRPFCTDNAMHVTNVLLYNLTVEKQEGVEGLILGTGADLGIGTSAQTRRP